jgi:hypothetical protein
MAAPPIDIIGVLATFSPEIRLTSVLGSRYFPPTPPQKNNPRLLFAPTRWKSTIVPSRHGGSSNMAFMLIVAGTALVLFAAALLIIERENAAT